MTGRGRGRRTILMIVHAYYEEDPRVRRQAEALVRAGRPVLVIGLRAPGAPRDDELAGVRVRRVDVQRHQGAGLGIYVTEYLAFLVQAMWIAVRAHPRERFAMVQVHSPPDFLAFAALPLRLVGVPLLLDLHEAMPEFFRSRFPDRQNRLLLGLLSLQERLSIGIASRVITVTDAMRDRLVGLGIPPAKVGVVINSPALARFDPTVHPRRAFREDGRLRIIYTGALTPTYELPVALRAFADVVAARPELEPVLELYGRGDAEASLRALAAELGVADRVTFPGRIPLDEVAAAVAAADIGIAPVRRDRFTVMSLSGKVYEYAAMEKPVVGSRLPMLEAAFPAGSVATYEPGDPASMARAILSVVDDADGRDRMVAAAKAAVEASSWDRESARYLELIDRLTVGNHRLTAGTA